MNLRPVLRSVGRLLLLLAGAQLIPALCSLFYGELATVSAFLFSSTVTAVVGLAMTRLGAAGQVYRREGILIVVGGWVLASLLGALPYLLTGTFTSPVDALFEAASGFTTTGATVLLDIEAASRGILFWRGFTQWLGGIGIIVLFVALLPELGPGARFLYKLEVPGPTAEGLKPRIKDTAMVLFRLYLLFTVAETLLLLLCGLSLYDALNHTFTTLSTGGFSPHADSIGAFPPVVHLVILIFMILAGGNFSLYYGLRRRRGWNLLRDAEFRIYLAIMAIAVVVMTWDLWLGSLRGTLDYSLPRALLDASFQTASIMTTTGFATTDFNYWPKVSQLILILLMFIGGCAGSTSGSIKVMRVSIGFKAALREVRLGFSPSTVISILVGGKRVPESVVRSVVGFLVLFVVSWGVGTLMLAAGDRSLVTAATAAIATLGNVGPGLDQVGPSANFAFFAGWEKLVMVLLMWLGRLEVYSIAALFTVAFWRR